LVRRGLLAQLGGNLALVESSSFDLPLLFQTIDNVLVSPANFMRQTLYSAIFPTGFQPQHSQRLRDDEPLLAIVRGRNTLEELETLKGSGTTGGLVRDHTADRSVEYLRGGTVMEGAGLFRVDNVPFMEEIMVSELVTEETTGDIDLLAADDGKFLTREDLLGDDAREATE